MGASRGVGRGGLAVEYKRAQTMTRASVDVRWDATKGDLEVVAGAQKHRVALAAWEMQDLLRIALDTPVDGMVEVSVDRVVGGQRNFYASPPLMLDAKPSPVGDWLQQADLEFAGIAGLGSSTANAELRALAPGARAQTLLETDSDYQLLARDVVAAPTPWPMIVFEVGPLDAATPVGWKAEFRPQFLTPDGQPLEAEPNHPWIEPWMEKQSVRPYEALDAAVESSSSRGRDLLRKHYPTVAAAERYALAIAALDIYCGDHRDQCRAWQRALPRTKAVDPSPVSYGDPADDVRLMATWNAVRMQVASAEKDPDYRCWIFIDEAIYTLNFGARYASSETLGLLPQGRCAGSEPGVGVQFLAGALKFKTELAAASPREASLTRAYADMEAAVRSIDRASALSADARALWKDRAAAVMIKLFFDPVVEKFPVVQSGLDALGGSLLGACVEALQTDAALARKKPTAKSAAAWRNSLARLGRCGWFPDDARLLASASFHFAVGMHEARTAGPEAAMHSRDRLRMLQSHVATAGPRDVEAIQGLVSKLSQRIRG